MVIKKEHARALERLLADEAMNPGEDVHGLVELE